MKITLDEWAQRNYSKPPSKWVLRKLMRSGEIQPPPEKLGRDWFVDESAQRVVFRSSLVERLRERS